MPRNRFFLCFRPPVPIDVVFEPKRGCPDDLLRDKGGITNSSSRMKASASQIDLSCLFLRKRTVSRIFKAMLRRSVRGTKGSRRRSRPSSTFHPLETKHPSSSLLVRLDSIDHIRDDQEAVKSNYSTTPSSGSLTTSSSSSETSRPLHLNDNLNINMEHPFENKYNKYLFLVSLAMTIFGGRACGIFFTSVWMYLSFRRRSDGNKRRREKEKRLVEGRVGSIMLKEEGHNGRPAWELNRRN